MLKKEKKINPEKISYISGNGNPEKILYVSGNTLLVALINLHQEIWECYSNFLIEWFFQFAHLHCEVWGSTFFTRKFVPSDFLSERQLKNAVDKVNCVFIKQILRVNSKASNWAVLSETNRSSLILGIMTRMILFWKHLQDSPCPIIEETVKLSKTLHEENHYSWFTGLSKVAEVLGETNDFLASTVQRKLALRRILESHWYSSRVKYSQGKLRLYTTLKERPGFETYLTLNNPKLRQAITKLRISAHKLPIETGRYDQKT